MTFSSLFDINLVRPILQTVGTSLIPSIMGRLGHYTVDTQTAVHLGHVTSLTSAIAENFFSKENKNFAYLTIPACLYASQFVQRFFYPNSPQGLDKKSFLVFSLVLMGIKYGVDRLGLKIQELNRARSVYSNGL